MAAGAAAAKAATKSKPVVKTWRPEADADDADSKRRKMNGMLKCELCQRTPAEVIVTMGTLSLFKSLLFGNPPIQVQINTWPPLLSQ